MTGSMISYPRDPVTQSSVGIRQSILPKLPSFLKSRKASSTSTSSSSSSSSTTSSEKHNYTTTSISRRSSTTTLAASEYSDVDSEKPRHASVMLSPKEAKKLAKAQEKAARKAQREIENEKARVELEALDKAMKYACFGQAWQHPRM